MKYTIDDLDGNAFAAYGKTYHMAIIQGVLWVTCGTNPPFRQDITNTLGYLNKGIYISL